MHVLEVTFDSMKQTREELQDLLQLLSIDSKNSLRTRIQALDISIARKPPTLTLTRRVMTSISAQTANQCCANQQEDIASSVLSDLDSCSASIIFNCVADPQLHGSFQGTRDLV